MSLSKSDLPHIQWSLLIFIAALLCGGGAIWASSRFIGQETEQQNAAQALLHNARSQINTAHSDQANMETYALKYSALLKQKVLGDDQRLDWMEGLSKLHKQNLVLDFKYTIAPQLPYTPQPALDSGNYELSLSGMTLQFDLLHEAQLMDFFDALRNNLNGWFMLDHCTLERSGSNNTATDPLPTPNATTATTPTLPAQLKAECSGGWLTLKIKGAK
jgi:hypothetical protein